MFERGKRLGKWSALLTAAALMIGAFTSVAPASSAPKNPSTFVLGATLPLTGSGAPYGQLFLFGINQAAKYINDHGGVGTNHAKLKVVSLDDQALAAPAVIDAKQLISVNHVAAILTAYNDPPLAQYKIGQKFGVPIINVGGNDPAIAGHPNLYTTLTNFVAEEVAAFTYAKAHGVKSVGILNANNYTTYDINPFNKIAANIFGASNVTAVTIDATLNDFTTQLQQLQAANPDIISPMSSGTLTLTIAQEMTQLNMTQKVAGINGMLNTPASIVNEPAWAGAYAGIPVDPPASWLNKAVLAATKAPASVYSEFAANGVYLVADAINAIEKAKGSPTSKNINAMISSFCIHGTKIAAAGGTITMGKNHVPNLAFIVSQIGAGGALTTIQTLTPAELAAELKAAGE
jgi:ABC-type branched-subunit amino acid transport system substrate-binding protein